MANVRQNRQTYVANRMDVQFADSEGGAVGAVQNANVSMSFGLDGVSGIGAVTMIEYVPTVARISVSPDQVYLFRRELDRVSAGGFGGQTGILPHQAIESLNGVVFNITAAVLKTDKDTNGQAYSTLWQAVDCFLDSGDFSTAKHGTVGRRCQFMALNYAVGSAFSKGAA